MQVRLSEDEKKRIVKAAGDVEPSVFVRTAAVRAADRVLARRAK